MKRKPFWIIFDATEVWNCDFNKRYCHSIHSKQLEWFCMLYGGTSKHVHQKKVLLGFETCTLFRTVLRERRFDMCQIKSCFDSPFLTKTYSTYLWGLVHLIFLLHKTFAETQSLAITKLLLLHCCANHPEATCSTISGTECQTTGSFFVPFFFFFALLTKLTKLNLR